MLTNETISKLNEMHLGTMASHFADQLTDSQFQSLSFEERFSILVDAEWSSRKSNRLAKLIKKAGYSAPGASIEDISFLPERKLDKAQILRLKLIYNDSITAKSGCRQDGKRDNKKK